MSQSPRDPHAGSLRWTLASLGRPLGTYVLRCAAPLKGTNAATNRATSRDVWHHAPFTTK